MVPEDAQAIVDALQTKIRSIGSSDPCESEACDDTIIEIFRDAPLLIQDLDLSLPPVYPTGLSEWMDSVRKNIRRLSSERKWDILMLAKASGVPIDYLQRLLKGEQSPSNLVLRKLAAAFNVHITVLDPSQEPPDSH